MRTEKKIAIVPVLLAALAALGSSHREGVATFEVVEIDPRGWVVTLEDAASGERAQIRLPPRQFVNQVVDAEVPPPGQTFSVRGRPGARFGRVAVASPMRSEGMVGSVEQDEGRFGGRYEPPARPPRPPAGSRADARQRGAPGGGLKITQVSEGERPVVTAVDTRTGEKVRFEVDPASFVGLEIEVDPGSLGQRGSVSFVAPNALPYADCCTRVE